MAQNGDAKVNEEAMDQQVDAADQSEVYKLAIGKKVNPEVAKELDALFSELSLTTEEFDERAIDALGNFAVDQAKFILGELKRSELYGVQNRPQFIMSVMRNFKDRVRQAASPAEALKNPLIPGPPSADIKSILDRTNYKLEVTVGQRKYHAPPDYTGPDPASHGHEIFIGQIPKDMFEDQLIPLFEEIGTIHDLRLMLDPVNGRNRGYAFLVYCEKEHAGQAAKKYDGHEILPGKQLKVNVSVANRRLFVGNIPKSKSKEEILEELKKHPELEGISDVIIYSSPDATENRKNRGFCFADFTDHKAASDARRRLMAGKCRPWNSDLVVDWAEQQSEPDEETMNQVKVLYVKNLKESVTEEKLEELYKPFGEFERAKKIRDYAFVHFKNRENALQALEGTKDAQLEGLPIEVSLAKPQGDKNKKKMMGMPMGMRGSPMRGKRGGGDFYGGRGRGGPGGPGGYGGRYGAPGGYGPPGGGYGAPGGYDYYGGGAGGGYYGGGAAPGGYAPYYDPYYAQGAGGGYGGGYGGGFGATRGGPKRGGFQPIRGGKRGAKRPGGSFDGPVSKRGGRGEDFSADVHY